MKQPHIIIFNPDQWRGDALGHMGHPAVQTPVLDQLVATDAVSFRHAFVQATVCTPSRCSFMTGWYPHVRGHRTMHHMLNPNQGEPNLLNTLRNNGYFIWWGGKNDLVPGQLGYEDHCDVKFRPSKEDYLRWGVHFGEGNHGGDLAWRGKPDGDNFYSFFKGLLPTVNNEKHFDSRDSPQAFLLYIYLSRCVWERLKTVSKPFISHEIKLIIMLFSSCMTRNHAYRGYRTCECLGVYGPILSFGVVDINAASRLSRTGAVRRHQRCDINADRLRWLPMPT